MSELSKSNRIGFNGKQLEIDNAATKSPVKSIQSSEIENRRPFRVINKHPKKETDFSSLIAMIPGTKSFSEVVQTRKGKKQILFVTDIIPKVICLKEFSSFISNGNSKIVSFLDATSKEILHCIDIHLANASTDMVVEHVGVNHLINDNMHLNIDNLVKNLISVVQKCNFLGVRNNFISGLVYN